MNNTTFSHFLPIIISSVRWLLCCYIIMILLTFVIIIKLRLIIRCITIIIGWTWCFTRIPITFWFPVTKTLCLRKFYISTNSWKISTDCRSYANNFNLIIFNRWLFSMMHNIFVRVRCIVKSIFLSLYFGNLKPNCFDNC